MGKEMKLVHLVGKYILIQIPYRGQGRYFKVKLVDVEPEGLWLESEDFNDGTQALGAIDSEKRVVHFFPYHQIYSVASIIPASAD